MSILNVIDNKYRDLWGMYDLQRNLKKKNIDLFFCNKFNWNLAINYINPSIIILPHIRNDSPHFKKIVNVAYEKKIKIICYPSESLDYRKHYLENEFPSNILDKIDKLFMWTIEQGKYIDEKDKDKIVVTGTTRFNVDKSIDHKGKIKTIGVTSSGRYLAPLTGNNNIMLTERGTMFGYNNLVTDFRSLAILKDTGFPVIFDATHSVQLPGGKGSSSGGQREFVELLAKAAVTTKISSIFIETHQNPSVAPSDGPNMISLKDLPKLLHYIKLYDNLAKSEYFN